jgi:hypothetical protein
MEKRWSLSDDVNIKPLNLRSNRAITATFKLLFCICADQKMEMIGK